MSDADRLRAFLHEHHTLVVATESEGQPWCTRVFFAEAFGPESVRAAERGSESAGSGALPTLYVMTKTPSRKLANLAQNNRVGLFVGPEFPTAWLEARGTATVIADPAEEQAARERLLAKAPEAGPFLARVTAVAVRIEVGWLRLTDAASDPRLILELGG